MYVKGTEDSLYLLSGWNKWPPNQGIRLPLSKHMNFLTLNGL
jgi:hypothetical protein